MIAQPTCTSPCAVCRTHSQGWWLDQNPQILETLPPLWPGDLCVRNVAAGVINSDFLERAQWRGEAAKEAQKQMEQMLQTSSFAQTPQQVTSAVLPGVMLGTRGDLHIVSTGLSNSSE